MYAPNAKQSLVAGPSVEPLDLATAKNFLRVTISADDALISTFISAARLRCEQLVDRSFITTTWLYTIDFLPFASNPIVGFPFPFLQYGSGGAFNRVDANDGAIFLPSPPLISVTGFTYVDPSGNTVAIDPSPSAGNVIVSTGTPGKIYPAYGKFYPIGLPVPQSVNITYTAGYGPSASNVPADVVVAMMFLLGAMYENRNVDIAIPRIVEDFLYRVKWGGYA